MRRIAVIALIWVSGFAPQESAAQCSICTKTAQQLGHKPAKALNNGIIYLMVAPLAIIGFVGLRWWRSNGQS